MILDRESSPNTRTRLLWLGRFLAVAVPVALFAGWTVPAFAVGFGISPPYIKNDSLTRNSHYEQQIFLVRGEPDDDLKITVTTNVPGADKWLSIDRGTEFIMPKGTTQMPITVSVNVPGDAAFKDYSGYVRIVVSPFSLPTAGTVGITIGAQADVNLNVIDKKIVDFRILNVAIEDAEPGYTWWWMHFPGKITALVSTENIGNVKAAPAKVVLDLSDITTGKVLEETASINRIEEINPFQTKTVAAEVPTRLPSGSYHVAYKVYKDDTNVISTGNLDLSILTPGTVPGYVGFGYQALPLTDKLITVGIVIAIIILICFIVRQIQLLAARRVMRRRGKQITAPPPLPGK